MGLVFFSCSNEDFRDNNPNAIDEDQNQINKTIEELSLSVNEELRLKFGRAFATALKESPELRKFIKDEALKQFNLDYDVMYHLVKDKPLNGHIMRNSSQSHYSTMSGLLSNYFKNKEELQQIEKQLPLLTVFVPSLPEDSFSAETWDVDDPEQIPVVGIRLDNTNEVPMIDVLNDVEYVLESDVIPGYPVVVIKNNERLVVNTNNHNFANSSEVLSTGGGLEYRFLDDNLNANITNNSRAVISTNPDDGGGGGGGGSPSPCTAPFAIEAGRNNNVAQFLKNARNIFEGSGVSNPWQRDNIYYQLTPSITTNAYIGGTYTEAITYFKLAGTNPESIFTLLSNQSNGSNPDPIRTNEDYEGEKRVPWTDGNFEIGISVTENAKNVGYINFPMFFNAGPEELFSYTHNRITRWRGVWPVRWKRTYYKPIINGFKGKDFTAVELGVQKLHIHAWDLTEYSNIWTIQVKELDVTTEFTDEISNVRKYNQNLEINPSISPSEIIKIGLKFGASQEDTDTTKRTFKWIEGDDELGIFTIPFRNDILIRNPCDNQLYPRLYENSASVIEIRPVQVEF